MPDLARPFFQGSPALEWTSELWGTEPHEIWGEQSSLLPEFVLDFLYVPSFENHESPWKEKLKPNVALYPCKS